jgi:hypothetical protein
LERDRQNCNNKIFDEKDKGRTEKQEQQDKRQVLSEALRRDT